MNKMLLDWMRGWDIPEEMLWKKGAVHQAVFMRDTVCVDLLKVPCFVVSSHTSKSIHLPVYGLIMRNGVKVVARYNFYDWKLSIELPKVNTNLQFPTDLVRGGIKDKIPDYYLEGMGRFWSYPAYSPKAKKFTIEVNDEHQVYVIMYVLKNAFPEKEFGEDNRSVDEIAESIEEIYKANGRYDTYKDHFGDKEFDRIRTSGWEILWNTWRKLEDCMKADGKDWSVIDKKSEDPKTFAEAICQYPEAKKVFLLQEYLYKTNI